MALGTPIGFPSEGTAVPLEVDRIRVGGDFSGGIRRRFDFGGESGSSWAPGIGTEFGGSYGGAGFPVYPSAGIQEVTVTRVPSLFRTWKLTHPPADKGQGA